MIFEVLFAVATCAKDSVQRGGGRDEGGVAMEDQEGHQPSDTHTHSHTFSLFHSLSYTLSLAPSFSLSKRKVKGKGLVGNSHTFKATADLLKVVELTARKTAPKPPCPSICFTIHLLPTSPNPHTHNKFCLLEDLRHGERNTRTQSRLASGFILAGLEFRVTYLVCFGHVQTRCCRFRRV